MTPRPEPDKDKPDLNEEERAAEPAKEARQAPASSERRGRHRVADDQQSGHGSLTALSKLMMMERKRAQALPSKE